MFSTVTGNHIRGIVVSNAGSARIGITNANNVFGANSITLNTLDGIGIFHSSAAFIGGNTIDSNGAFGINVGGASGVLVGGNTVTNNAQSGVLAGRGAQVLIGDPGFGPSTTLNTISGNGGTGPTRGGIFAFDNANIQVTDAVISDNSGAAVNSFSGALVDLRGGTAVTAPATSFAGAVVSVHATLRLVGTASIISLGGDGIQASDLSAVSIESANTVQGTSGAGPGFGVNCFVFGGLTASGTTLTGDLTHVTGTLGSTTGCNVFP